LKDQAKCYKYAERNERAKRQRIYYFNGGGWQLPADGSHWKFATALLNELPYGTIMSLVSYPLAPNNPAPISFPQLMRLYHTEIARATAEDEIVTFAGDSSGGNVALCLPLEALTQDPNALHPHSILAICPSTDLTRSNPKLREFQKHDPILKVKFVMSTAKAWAGDWDKRDPRISPLFSEHINVLAKAGVRVDGCTGGSDLLGPDCVLFRDKLAENGVLGEWLEWDKMMHVWPLVKTYRISPEADEAFLWIADLLRRRGEEGVLDEKVLGVTASEESGESGDLIESQKI
jgi:acetyl esterase/lipase